MNMLSVGMYILVDKKPVREPNIYKWGEFQQRIENRHVAATMYLNHYISTVFLGMDHGFGDTPILFETMVFNDKDEVIDHYTQRYTTWDDAEKGHTDTVHDMITNGIREDEDSDETDV